MRSHEVKKNSHYTCVRHVTWIEPELVDVQERKNELHRNPQQQKDEVA